MGGTTASALGLRAGRRVGRVPLQPPPRPPAEPGAAGWKPGGIGPSAALEVIPVRLAAQVRPGDDLAAMIALACPGLRDGDILVVSQKAVSKQEGRTVRLSDVAPSELSAGLASAYGKDPRIVELIMSEARRIVRMGGAGGVIITETRAGLVCANSGVDESNAPDGHAVLLPEDPDASAARLRARIAELTGRSVAVVVSDTFGRPFRVGQADCAIGSSGLGVARDHAGCTDATGRTLRVTSAAVADEVCAAAELVKGKAASVPAAVVRNCGACGGGGEGRPAGASAADLVRDAKASLF